MLRRNNFRNQSLALLVIRMLDQRFRFGQVTAKSAAF
jgi:hypothetical protein